MPNQLPNAPRPDGQPPVVASNEFRSGAETPYEYSQRGDYTQLKAHLDSSESAVDFLPYWRSVCSLVLNLEDSAEQAASTIKWINENCDEDGYWTDDDYVWSTAPQAADSWGMRESLVTLAVDAGALPAVWDALVPSVRRQLVEDQLYESVDTVSDRLQLAALRDRVRDLAVDQEPESQASLLNAIESRLLLLEDKPLESMLVWLRQDLSAHDSVDTVEQRLLVQLAGIGYVDLYEEVCDRIPDEDRGQEHEQWRKLAVDLREHNGDAVLENPVFEQLRWNHDYRLVQLMHRCGVVASASKHSPVSAGFAHVPGLLLRLRGSWESAAAECMQKLDGWDRVEEIDRFPSALAAWTREDPQGRWVAAIYETCPPGLDSETMPAEAIAGKLFLQIANLNSASVKPGGTALHAFATQQLAGWAAIDSVYTSSQSIAWPSQELVPAIRDHMTTGRVDLRWVDYLDCWKDSWPKYSLPQFESDSVFVMNVGGIVERVRCDEVSGDLQAAESTAIDDWPVYRLTQPSISFPALSAGTYVR